MKRIRRALSLILVVCILASMAIISTVSVAAVKKAATSTRPVITDVVNSDPKIQVDTKRYYFYMPDSWKNTYNDNYDGKSLDSCAAGIYWWSTSYNCDKYKGSNEQGWPGFLILNNLADYPNIFYCDVPEDAGTIIFNNTVDGGQDTPGFGYDAQTTDIKTEYSSSYDDPYGFYENLDTMDDMIFVVNPLDMEINELSGALTGKGDWFYYYGDGTYGITPQKGSSYFANGDFPSTQPIVKIAQRITAKSVTKIYGAKAFSLKAKTSGNGKLSYSSSNKKVATVSSSGKVTIKGEGKATITIKASATSKYKAASKKITVTIKSAKKKAQKITAKSYTKAYGEKAFSLKAKTSGNGKLSYKTSNKKVATVSSGGKVTIKGVGKATITIKAKATSKYKAASKRISLTVKPAKVKIKYFKGNKKSLKIYYAKQKNVDGYQCVYNRGKKNIKTTSKKNYVTLKNLKKGTCTAKIRAYKKISGKKVYGKYGKYQLTIA